MQSSGITCLRPPSWYSPQSVPLWPLHRGQWTRETTGAARKLVHQFRGKKEIGVAWVVVAVATMGQILDI